MSEPKPTAMQNLPPWNEAKAKGVFAGQTDFESLIQAEEYLLSIDAMLDGIVPAKDAKGLIYLKERVAMLIRSKVNPETLAATLTERNKLLLGLLRLKEHLEEDGGATCDIATMHKIICEAMK